MRFRRRSFHRGARAPREPLFWDRLPQQTTVDVSGVYGAVAGITVFDPTTVIAGNQDMRITVRRIRFVFATKLVDTAGSNIGQMVAAGIYVARAGEPDRDPLYTAAADERTDWMWHWSTTIFGAAAAETIIVGPAAGSAQGANAIDGNDLCSVRAMRKLDQDEVIRLVFSRKRLDPAVDAAPTTTRQVIGVIPSTLYQRTMRR